MNYKGYGRKESYFAMQLLTKILKNPHAGLPPSRESNYILPEHEIGVLTTHLAAASVHVLIFSFYGRFLTT
jgi:hypothetical protein